MNRKLNFIVRALLYAGMILGLAAVMMILLNQSPFGGKLFTQINDLPWSAYISGGLAVLCVFGGEYIGWTLLKMMRSLGSDPFVVENVIRLRRMGYTALLIMALCLLTLVFWPVPLLVIGGLPVGMCGLFSLVLSQVFSTAVAAKQENDLTV